MKEVGFMQRRLQKCSRPWLKKKKIQQTLKLCGTSRTADFIIDAVVIVWNASALALSRSLQFMKSQLKKC